MPRAGIPVELCRVETDDGHILDGALYGSAAIKTGVTFVVVHGTGSNFYSPGPLETFALLASQAGHAACRVNTQGHDGMAGIPGRNGTTPGGAAFEKAADGGKDVAAWVRHFASLGADRIVLVGHSMGGLKSLLAARELATENLVDAVVCFSPPWLSHEHWMWHPLSCLLSTCGYSTGPVYRPVVTSNRSCSDSVGFGGMPTRVPTKLLDWCCLLKLHHAVGDVDAKVKLLR